MGCSEKLLVVVGGSRGIGAAVAKNAVGRGYQVALGYHTQSGAAQQVVSEIEGFGGDAVAFPVDVADAQSVKRFYSHIVAECGIPNAIAHCAGHSTGRCSLLETPIAAISECVSTNLIGVLYSVRAAAQIMAISRGGCGGTMVLLSSEAARFGGNRIAPYAASKAGVNALTVGLARELAAEGIRLNAVSPGVIDTDLQADLTGQQQADLLKSIPLGRMGRSEEVARSVLWLLSEDACYITGTVLSITGGR